MNSIIISDVLAQVTENGIGLGNIFNKFKVDIDSYEEVIKKFSELKLNRPEFKLDDGKANWDAIAKAIEGCDETALSYFKTLDDSNGTINNQSASVEGLSEHLKATGQSFNFAAIKATLLNTALNAGIMLAVTVAVKALSAAWDVFNVTVEEQQEKISNLQTEYEGLQSEYDELSSKQALTDTEKERLEYLEKRLELDKEILEAETRDLYKEQRGNKWNPTDWFDKDSNVVKSAKEFGDFHGGWFNLSALKDGYHVTTSKAENSLQTLENLKKIYEDLSNEQGKYEQGSIEYNQIQADLNSNMMSQTGQMKELEKSYDILTQKQGEYLKEAEVYKEQIDSGLLSGDDLKDAENAYNQWNDAYETVKSLSIEVGQAIGKFDEYGNKVEEVKEEISNTETSFSLSDRFKNLWDSDSFKDTREEITKLSKESKITASDINNLANENAELSELLNESGMSAQFAAECFDRMCRGGDGFDAITSDTLLLDQVLNGMTASLEQVTNAKSSYDEAMSKADYNVDFKNYQEAYASAMEMFENGEYGKHFRDTMEYLLGADSYTMSIDELYTAVQNLGSVFGESATNGYEFLDKLYAKKEILDDMDSSLTKLSDGSYNFDLKPDEFEAIADALGMTTEEVTACTNALGMFGDYSSYDLDELELALNSISIAAHDGEKSITSLQGVENILSDLGYSGYDVYQIMQQIQGMGSIELIDFENGNLDDTLSKLKELENVKVDGSNINLDSLISGMQALGNSNTDIANFISRLNGQFNLTDAQGQLIDFETAKNQALSSTENGVSNDIAKAGEEAEKSATSVSNVGTEVDKLNSKSLSQVQLQFVNVSTAANTAKNNVQSIIDKINALNGTKININSSDDGGTNGNGGSKPKKKAYHGTVGNAFASGTFSDVPDLPITGYSGLPKDEKNALRSEYGQPELTVYPNGKTELTTKPTMADLPKGTLIFNEKQTKKIMNGSGHISGKAYASGTVKKTTSTSTSKSKSKSKDKEKKSSKTEIDWITRKLEQLQKKIDLTKAKFENLFSLKSKSSNLDTQIKQTTKLMNAESKAAQKYKKKAESYAKSSKLSKSLQRAVQEGRLDKYSLKDLIKKYGEKTANKIQEYQNYWNNYQEAQKQTVELETEIRNLKEEQYQLYVDEADANIDKLNAEKDIAIGYKDQNKYLDNQKAHLKQSYDYQIKIAELTKDEVKKAQLQAEYEKALRDLENEKFENIKKYYESQIDLIDASENAIKDQVDLLEAKGMSLTAKYYDDQIAYEKQKQAQLQKSKAELETQLKYIVKDTDKWYDVKSAIAEVNSELVDCNKSIAEMNSSITTIADNFMDKMIGVGNTIMDTMDWAVSLMDNVDTFNSETGMMTKEGFATLGSYVSGYNTSGAMSEMYRKLTSNLESNYNKKILSFVDANGIKRTYNSLEEFKAAINDTYEEWRDQISKTHDYESKIVDMMKKKLENELSALKDLIDAKEKALQQEKELFSYQNSIRKSTQNVASLEKQIAALQGDTSEETSMRIQKLQKELSDEREDLQEKEYDRYISDQQDMLDKLYDEYESFINSEMQDVKKLLADGIAIAQSMSDNIEKTVNDYVAPYDYNGRFDSLDTAISNITNDSDSSIANTIKNIANEGVENATQSTDTVTVNGESHGTGYKKIEAIPETLKTPVLKTLPDITPTTKAVELNNGKSALSAAKSYVKKHAVKAAKKKSEYSDVNKVIYDNKAKTYSGTGKVLSNTSLKGLAKELGIKYDNSKKSGKLYTTLKKIKFPGFKKGGIVSVDDIEKQVHNNGDDGLVSVKNGEGFIPVEMMPQFKELIENMPVMNDLTKSLAETPDFSNLTPVMQNEKVENTIDLSITLPNVKNYNEFMSQMQADPRFTKLVQSIGIDQSLGGARLAKNKIHF